MASTVYGVANCPVSGEEKVIQCQWARSTNALSGGLVMCIGTLDVHNTCSKLASPERSG
jgi:hypothetical protein